MSKPTTSQFADLIRRTGRQAGFSFPNPVRRTKGLTMAKKVKTFVSKRTGKTYFTAPRKVKRAVKVNRWFPGRPNYTGPQKGWFAMLHHTVLAEFSTGVDERVYYVKRHKPVEERATRLRNMMYLGVKLGAKLTKAWEAHNQMQPRNESHAMAWMHKEIQAKMAKLFPKHGWSDTYPAGLRYPNGAVVKGQ